MLDKILKWVAQDELHRIYFMGAVALAVGILVALLGCLGANIIRILFLS